MAGFFAVLLVCLVAAIGIACAINYFLACGPWRALGFGLFGVAIFMLFAASGMWVNAAPHDWGKLAPVFAFMLIGGWFCLKYGARLWTWWKQRPRKKI